MSFQFISPNDVAKYVIHKADQPNDTYFAEFKFSRDAIVMPQVKCEHPNEYKGPLLPREQFNSVMFVELAAAFGDN